MRKLYYSLEQVERSLGFARDDVNIYILYLLFDMKKIRVGFIGLGLMGRPMAQNLLKAGFSLTVYNRTTGKTDEFKKLGCKVFSNTAELAKNVEIVISMVTGPEDVKEVYLGKDGVIQGVHKDLIAIDMSTIGPTAAIEVASLLSKKNIDFLDAPVTGSVPKAISGELTIFIGGEKRVFEKVKDIFLAMGKNLQYMGPTGAGQAIKLINNMIAAISLTGLAEGILLADNLGLKREKMVKALENSPVTSPYLRMKFDNFVDDDYQVAFSMNNMRKDLRLALSAFSKNNKKKKLPLLKISEKLLTQGVENGWGEKDLSAVIKVLEK